MNEMRDLKLAKDKLKEGNLSLVIIKASRLVFESGRSGVRGLLQAIEKLGAGLHESSAADRVVGRAAALLLVYSHVKEVYATILSFEGLKVLDENHVPFEYDVLVPKVLDRARKNICPFERVSLKVERPCEAYEIMMTFAESLTGNLLP